VASSVLALMGDGVQIFSIDVDLTDNMFTVDVKQRLE
jgi:hypothetical protein